MVGSGRPDGPTGAAGCKTNSELRSGAKNGCRPKATRSQDSRSIGLVLEVCCRSGRWNLAGVRAEILMLNQPAADYTATDFGWFGWPARITIRGIERASDGIQRSVASHLPLFIWDPKRLVADLLMQMYGVESTSTSKLTSGSQRQWRTQVSTATTSGSLQSWEMRARLAGRLMN